MKMPMALARVFRVTDRAISLAALPTCQEA